MKITELENKLEDLWSNLQIILETVDVIEIAVSSGTLKEHNAEWALTGVARDLSNAIKDVESLTNETIKMRSILEVIQKGELA